MKQVLEYKWFFSFLVLFACSFHAEAQPHVKRICASITGTNTILWKSYKNPDCNVLSQIVIYGKKDQFGIFEKIDSLNDEASTSYDHVGAINYARGYYFLSYEYQCNGIKTIVNSDTIAVDVAAPDVIEPDSVSVGKDGKIYIGWTANKATDTKSYIIYQTVNGKNFPIDTVFGINTTHVTDSVFGKPSMEPEEYRIAAVDSCDNIAPIGKPHKTMFLQISQDTCAGTISLNWSAYIGWTAIDHYTIFMSEDNGVSYKPIDTTSSLTYIFKNGKTNTLYRFFVRAYKKGNTAITSSSNVLQILSDFGNPLQYVYLKTVTVDGDHLRMDWSISSAASIASFTIYRGTQNANYLFEYAKVPASGITDYSWSDNNASIEDDYYYQIVVHNSCGREVGRSNVSNNMVLHLSASSTGNLLNWNPYEDWSGNVSTYEVYRNLNISDKWELISTLNANELSYLDTDSFEEYGKEGICYKIIAKESSNNKFGFKEESLSNTVCHIDAPFLHIPNAFSPDGMNKVFKPIFLHVDTFTSSMEIYNRWGEQVFTTDNLSTGWDGNMANGKLAPSGMYLYIIRMVGYNRSIHNYKGVFYLIR